MKGCYHSIETMGTHDGAGIRYILFLQGCLMRCKFCHNPDTWATYGKEITSVQVINQVKEYKPYFISTGGGITISGGEPLVQAPFVTDVFSKCKDKGINTTLDTSGYGSVSALDKVLAFSDQVLFSIKVVDSIKHKQLTSISNEIILANLKLVLERKGKVNLRYVVIPKINDSKKDLNYLLMLIKSLPGEIILELLPYHRMGIYKWELLGIEYQLKNVIEPSNQDMQFISSFFRKEGCQLFE